MGKGNRKAGPPSQAPAKGMAQKGKAPIVEVPALYELAWGVFGLLGGFALSPLWTPGMAAVAVGVALTIPVLRFAAAPLVRRYDLRIGWSAVVASCMAVAFGGWALTRFATADQVPMVTYSLTAPTIDQAAPFKLPDEKAWYRLRVTNPSDVDVSDLHVSVHLPDVMVARPRLVTSSSVESPAVKPAYTALSKKASPEATAEPIEAFPSLAVVEARRMLPGGIIDAVFPVRGAAMDVKENGRWGAIKIERRHRHFNEEVQDVEAYPIVSMSAGEELLGSEKLPIDDATKLNIYGPMIRPEHRQAIDKGGKIEFELLTE